jgi:O-antigen/teichoic acid export membrane protein
MMQDQLTADFEARRASTAVASGQETTKQIRGSTLLLVGRVASLALTMATQVVLVRSLSRSDYGLFAYAIALAGSTRSPVTLGQWNSLSRFLSIYDERGDARRVVGVLGVAIVTVVASSVVLVSAVAFGGEFIATHVLGAPGAGVLLLILVGLGPLEGLDSMFVAIFAVFSRPRMIFFRKYILTPGLRLVAVLLLAGTHQGATVVAWGYLAAGIVGILVYAWVAITALRARGLLSADILRRAVLPFREMYRFSIPLMTQDLVSLSMTAGTATFVAYFAGASGVAGYRVVYPAARVNQFVIFSFTALFLPLSSRLFARGDREGMGRAYWQTAAWLAVLTFPVFVLTVPLAQPVTVALFGERYADAVPILALLSFGFYFNAALGFNALTLQIAGRIRYVVGVNVVCALANVALSLVLVRAYGALGAAVANCITLVLLNVLNQAGLPRAVGVGMPARPYARCYAIIGIAGAAVWVVQAVLSPSLAGALCIAALASLGVLFLTRDVLAVTSTFPELSRLPLLGRLLSGRGPGVPGGEGAT